MGHETFNVAMYVVFGIALGLLPYSMCDGIWGVLIFAVIYLVLPLLLAAIIASKRGTNIGEIWEDIINYIDFGMIALIYLGLPVFYLLRIKCHWLFLVLAEVLQIALPFAYAWLRNTKDKERDFEQDIYFACRVITAVYLVPIIINLEKTLPPEI